MTSRKLSPYEQTHLHRFGKGDIDLADYGEMPVEYITGKVEFGGRVLIVNKNVLIPRVETEELVDLAVKEIAQQKALNNQDQSLVIADIGCGSGAIGISVYLQLQQLDLQPTLYLSDISTAALAVAQQNVERLINKKDQVLLLTSDLLSNFADNLRFDLIMANLPYIPSKRIARLTASVKDYEPHLALDGGADGLKYIKKLIPQARPRLKPGGAIVLEVDETHDEPFLKNNLELKGLALATRRDQFTKMRFAIIKKSFFS